MKHLKQIADPKALKELREAARNAHLVIYYDKPYNHFKWYGCSHDLSWTEFLWHIGCILPRGSYQIYTALAHGNLPVCALRVRVV